MRSYKNLVSSETKSLREYLKLENGNTFLIPFSQRNYEWGKTEVERLFNDLTSLYDEDQKYHMLNFFTLYRDDNNLKIFDGQQRTVTCMLILAVIAQRLFTEGNKEAAEQIQTDYFIKKDALRPNEEQQRKLIFDVVNDNDFFYQVTNVKYNLEDISQNENSELTSNQKSIYNNMKHINLLLDELIKTSEEIDLSKLALSVIDQTLLIEFDASNEDIALSMFESLNNTGKSIEKYYVLKNDMVKCLGESIVKEKWKIIDSNLNGLNHNDFLKSVATLTAGKTSSNKVLDHLYANKDIKDQSDMRSLLESLYLASNSFLKICNPSQMKSGNTKELERYRHLTDQLKLFSMKQQRPIILAMLLKNKTLNEINKILAVIIELSVKNFYFCEQKANTIEGKFAQYAYELYSGKLSTEKLLIDIRNLCVDDKRLAEAIKNRLLPLKNNSRLSFILRETYNYAYRNKELEISSFDNDVEHILPRTPKPTSEWRKWFPDEEKRTKYTNNIGNVTLWYSTDNRSAKNADFSDKCAKYKNSILEENKKIAENDKWTDKKIDARASYMAKLIIRAFSEY